MHSVDGPEQYPCDELDDHDRAYVSHRLRAPHLDNLRHEPEAGESRCYRPNSIPSYIIHFLLANMLACCLLAVKDFERRDAPILHK